MLPNLKILVCAAVFAPLLFAVTGAGVLLPDSYTRVGEMPEIGRPMMQRMIVDEPAQAQFYVMTVARRSEELERLRALDVVADVAPGQSESDILKPAVIENPISEVISVTDVATPAPQPSDATGMAPKTASGAVLIRTTEIGTNVSPDAADPLRVAALS